MKKITKLFSVLLALALSTSILSSAEACEGQTTYSCGTEDMFSMINQFNQNCCEGSTIIIVDVCYGAISTYSNTGLESNGFNSSCGPQ